MAYDKNIKAVPYKVSIDYGCGITDYETRYRIVATDTGEILDDAQGYGYKSIQKAFAAYAYKHRDRSKDAEKAARKRHIEKWLEDHKDFENRMDDAAIWALKDNEDFTAKDVKAMLADDNLEVDFTAEELMRVWRDR
jgi:hypothetical protein